MHFHSTVQQHSSTDILFRLFAATARAGIVPARSVQRVIWKRLQHKQGVLGQARTSMAHGTAALEERYLHFATAVEELSGLSTQIVGDADRLVKLASGGEAGESIVGKTVTVLTQPLDYLLRAGSGVRSTIEVLEQINTTAKRLLVTEQDLAKAMLPMDSIQVLFRVESARLSPDIQQMFQALMTDIETMQRKVRQIFTANTTLLRGALRELPRVLASMREMASLHESAGTRKKEIDRTLAELQEEVQRGEGRNVQLTQVARSLASDINSIVVSLQTHDIVSQRLAHVDSALGLIDQGISELGSAPATEMQRLLADVRGATAVQQRQIDSTRHDLETCARTCQSAVQDVDKSLRTLDQDCLLLREFQAMTAAVDRMIQTLLESMTDVGNMMRSSVESAGSAHKALSPIANGAQQLSGELVDISADMRRIALNTQIQAARVGHRTGLEVIAASTERAAKEAMSISLRVASNLDEIRAGFADAVKLLSELEVEGERQLNDLLSTVAEHEQHLHAMRDQTLRLVTDTGKGLESVMKYAQDLASEVTFAEVIHERFDSLSSALAHLSQELDVVCGIHGAQNEIGASHTLEAMYTMASERATHADALQQTAVSGLPASDSSGDVELF